MIYQCNILHDAYFQTPKICLSFLDNLICFMGTGMIESMLEPHMIKEAHSSHEEVGLAFMIYSLVYTLASPLAGYVSYLLQPIN